MGGGRSGYHQTASVGSAHKGQVYYRCYRHLSEDNGVRFVMGENLIADPSRGMFTPATPPVPVIGAAVVGAATNAGPAPAEVEVAHGVPCDQQQRIGVLRNIVAPGAISRWVQSCASSDG